MSGRSTDDYPPIPYVQYAELVEHQEHRRELYDQTQPVGKGTDIIDEAYQGDSRQSQYEPGIFKTGKQKIYQRSQIKDDSAAPQGDAGMRTPSVGFVDDVESVRYAEIQQFRRKKNGGNQKIIHSMIMRGS